VSTLRGSCSAEVNAGIARCWALVGDIAVASQWQRGLERLVVVEHDDQGRPLICDTLTNAKLTKIACRIRISYAPPHRLSWSQVSSEDLDSMTGSWELEEVGPALTRATYALAVDPGAIGRLARPLERIVRPFVIGHQTAELAAALAAHG